MSPKIVSEEESERTQSQRGRNGSLFDFSLPGEKRPAAASARAQSWRFRLDSF